ncbi:MAG: hypothetical protein ACPHT7_05830 [Litorivicinaceae bacterium]
MTIHIMVGSTVPSGAPNFFVTAGLPADTLRRVCPSLAGPPRSGGDYFISGYTGGLV